MGQGELEVLGEELLDVGATDALSVLDLDNLEDLFEEKMLDFAASSLVTLDRRGKHTAIEPKRAR